MTFNGHRSVGRVMRIPSLLPVRLRAGRSVALAFVLAFAACTSGASGTDTASIGGTSETPAPVVPTPGEAQAPSPEPELPEITSVTQAGGEAIRAPEEADWVLVDFGRAWVSGVGNGIGFYDAQTGRLQGSAAVPQAPCASMDSGFGAVWTATCRNRGVARVDPGSGEVTGWVAVDVPADGESSIGAGEGAVWAIADGDGCSGCVLVRIDTGTVETTDTYDVPEGATAVRAGLGGIWITYASGDRVVRVDAETGEVVSEVDVGAGPRFLDVGEGGVWVMNQTDGSVSHIDPTSDMVVATIPVDGEAIFGGDVTVGDGFVWLRANSELVAQIDPATDRVVARIGPAQASGGAHASDGQLWIADHYERPEGWRAVLYRIPLADARA
jgi:virginiamycin B lyase